MGRRWDGRYRPAGAAEIAWEEARNGGARWDGGGAVDELEL